MKTGKLNLTNSNADIINQTYAEYHGCEYVEPSLIDLKEAREDVEDTEGGTYY